MGKYYKIKLHGGGSYIQPADSMDDAIDGEIDGLAVGESCTLTIERVEMTPEEYAALPEFTGH